MHELRSKIKYLKPWYFLVIAIFWAIICVFALRANNQHMAELRSAVYQADKENGDVQGALQDLQSYVTSHMNTNLDSGSSVYPPIQLEYTYKRIVQSQGADKAKANAQIYTDAQKFCEQQNSQDVSGRNRVPCIQQYVTSHTTPANAPIPDALYKFSFVTPKWSPDLAGWSMVFAIFNGVVFLGVLVAQQVYKRFIR